MAARDHVGALIEALVFTAVALAALGALVTAFPAFGRWLQSLP